MAFRIDIILFKSAKIDTYIDLYDISDVHKFTVHGHYHFKIKANNVMQYQHCTIIDDDYVIDAEDIHSIQISSSYEYRHEVYK